MQLKAGKAGALHGGAGDIIDFIDNSPLPASVVSGAGEIIYVNDKMSRLLRAGVYASWAGNGPGEKGAPGVEGVLSQPAGAAASRREPQAAFLLAAIRIPAPPYPMVLVWADEENTGEEEREAAIERLLSLARVTARRSGAGASVAIDDDGLVPADLRDLTQSAARTWGLPCADVENLVESGHVIEATSPMILKRMIQRALGELCRFDLHGPITIRGKTQPEPAGGNTIHMLSLQAESLRLSGKSGSSELTAMGIRLKIFTRNLAAATGFRLDPPRVLRSGGAIEIQLSFPGRMENASAAPSGSGDFANLSAREREVVEMVRAGFDNVRISERLGISHATVKQHLKAVYKKVGVKNRVELIFKDISPV